jgi:hypothetical protein
MMPPAREARAGEVSAIPRSCHMAFLMLALRLDPLSFTRF